MFIFICILLAIWLVLALLLTAQITENTRLGVLIRAQDDHIEFLNDKLTLK